MRLQHNFTILDIDCLVDLKGLLTYMAQRIQLGKLCLFCSKQFKDPGSCQQHMIDTSHCFMNMEDEDEYLEYYDFSKTYENHPLLNKAQEIRAIKESEEEGEEGEEWEDCDVEDMNSEEAEAELVDHEDIEVDSSGKGTNGSQVVGESEEAKKSDSSFADVSAPQSSDFGIESLSSIKSKKSKLGKTREEVFLGLDIKKAELMSTGEVRLGNGKIMGHRKYNNIYK